HRREIVCDQKDCSWYEGDGVRGRRRGKKVLTLQWGPGVADALFWDRKRPRLPSLPLANLVAMKCRRGRLRSQKSAPITPRASLKGEYLPWPRHFSSRLPSCLSSFRYGFVPLSAANCCSVLSFESDSICSLQTEIT